MGRRKREAPEAHRLSDRISATEAQNRFGRLLETAARDHPVVITRHNRPQAVLMSIDHYNKLSGSDEAVLDVLTDEFDALLERMQTSEARAGMERLFEASTQDLGRAAVAEAERRDDD